MFKDHGIRDAVKLMVCSVTVACMIGCGSTTTENIIDKDEAAKIDSAPATPSRPGAPVAKPKTAPGSDSPMGAGR